ncbi:terminase small subunit, partial [Algoriphagus sediminis]
MKIFKGLKPDYLTDREFLFANYYLGEANLNATEAAKLAGYSEHTARQQGSRLLSNVNIKSYIQSQVAEVLEKEGVTQERVLREIISLAFARISDLYQDGWTLKPVSQIPKDKIGAIDVKITESNNGKRKTVTVSNNSNAK